MTLMFVNLPISNLERSMEFYEQLGFQFNPQFTSQDTGCMIVSETNYVMLLERDRFRTFIDKDVADTKSTAAALIALMLESAQDVKDMCERAFSLGARRYKEPEDMGFMFSWGFEDLDGNIFELGWMDPSNLK